MPQRHAEVIDEAGRGSRVHESLRFILLVNPVRRALGQIEALYALVLPGLVLEFVSGAQSVNGSKPKVQPSKQVRVALRTHSVCDVRSVECLGGYHRALIIGVIPPGEEKIRS